MSRLTPSPLGLPLSLGSVRMAVSAVALVGATISASTAQAKGSCESGDGFELRGGTLRLERHVAGGGGAWHSPSSDSTNG